MTPLGGVRADFVANLGRRLSELRQHWASFEQEPGVIRHRDEVRRRIHALTTRSRLLEFGVMADKLDEAEHRLDQAASTGSLVSEEIAWFHDLFRVLPSLAWNEVAAEQPMSVPTFEPTADGAPQSQPPPAGFPLSVLVVGAEPLRQALTDQGHVPGRVEMECERTEDMKVAIDLARALAPDLVVIDVDLEGAIEFVKALASDPLTEPVPVVVVGTWSHPDQATELLSLGIVRCLPKPVPPDLLRAAAEQAFSSGGRVAPDFAPMGDLTVDEVADRLVAQLRAGLVLAVRPESRGVRIQLDKGTELLAAVWSAVARVRETLTIRSNGDVRFSANGPSGAVPIAPWLDDPRSEVPSRRRAGRDSQEQTDSIRLEGRKILVVDDDPAITWFLSGLLRAAGAFVYEAHNGRKALELAFRATPDLVISDIIMPELDGFGLCRELKRDIALRDAPVILLSWKEDLLQRVRELGARADGYIKKESSASSILRRVHEVLQPRIRVESRLRAGGEVRGRLDGLTARTLLQLVGTAQADARLTVRDAKYVYEVELRDGAPRAASRTAQDGAFVRGEAVLVSLLGVASGRFYAFPSSAQIRATLRGDLTSQLNPLIARARAAQSLLSGDRLLEVRNVSLALDQLMIDAMPEHARATLMALGEGIAPQELILSRRAAPAMVEALLDDAAIHGGIEAIIGPAGNDLLVDETRRQLDSMNIPVRSRTQRPPAPSEAPAEQAPAPRPEAAPRPEPSSKSEPVAKLEPAPSREPEASRAPTLRPAPEASRTPTPRPEPDRAAIRDRTSAPELIVIGTEEMPELIGDHDAVEEHESGDGLPSSLTEAVIREVLDPEGRSLPSPRPPPPMLDARELKPRSVRTSPAIPSLPPDAIVPGPETPSLPAPNPEPSVPEGATGTSPELVRGPLKNLAALQPQPVPEIRDYAAPEDDSRERVTEPAVRNRPPSTPAAPKSDRPARDESKSDRPAREESKSDRPARVEPKSDRPAREEPKARRDEKPKDRKPAEVVLSDSSASLKVPTRSLLGPIVVIVLIVVALVAGGVWLKAAPEAAAPAPSAPLPSATQPAVSAPAPKVEASSTPSAAAPEESAPAASASAAAPPADHEAAEEDLPLPVGSRLPKGTSLLEVRTQQPDAVVFVEGRQKGTGPVVAVVVKPGPHTVLVRWRGKEISREVNVRSDRRTRFSLVPP
ncbi:MAG: response regulator [Deltaproteobacteria bacterium]|nr:response regulator [Deltaproteobacteria bacterium]